MFFPPCTYKSKILSGINKASARSFSSHRRLEKQVLKSVYDISRNRIKITEEECWTSKAWDIKGMVFLSAKEQSRQQSWVVRTSTSSVLLNFSTITDATSTMVLSQIAINHDKAKHLNDQRNRKLGELQSALVFSCKIY